MKINVLIFSLLFLNINLFSQTETLELSGAWCTDNLKLNLVSGDEIKVLSWEIDGVLQKKYKNLEINCSKFGEGEYTVNYKVNGEKKSLSTNVQPAAAFKVDFTGEYFPAAAVTIFDDLSTVSNDKIVALNWNFGDGTTSQKEHPQVFFKENIEYDVTLLIKTENGCEYSITKKHLANN